MVELCFLLAEDNIEGDFMMTISQNEQLGDFLNNRPPTCEN